MNLKKTLPIFLMTFLTVCIPLATAADIPAEYSSSLQLNTEYTYNVEEFEAKPIYWVTLDYSSMRDVVRCEAGGQIIVKLVKFDAKEAADYSSSAFPSQIPYIDITFKNKTGTQTAELTGISNSEAAMALALSYSGFLSGFIIPVSDLSGLESSAEAQNAGFMAAIIKVTEAGNSITFSFDQTSGAQKTVVTYDKTTGVLQSAEVDNLFGPDLKITLNQLIPGYPIELLTMGISLGAIMVIMLKLRRK